MGCEELVEYVRCGGEWIGDCVWALPILWEQGECWMCVCVLVAVV